MAKRVFLATVGASRKTSIQVQPGVLREEISFSATSFVGLAHSEEEALGSAIKQMRERCKAEEGWEVHMPQVSLVPRKQILDWLGELELEN